MSEKQEKPYHYYGSTAYNWATGATRREVLEKLARMAGADLIKRHVKGESGGMYAWTTRVELPQSADYTINQYAPEFITKDGKSTGELVPMGKAQQFNIMNAKGYAFPIDARDNEGSEA